ncbi:FAD-dependent monooxygenase [Brevibacterium sp. GP-SGM9]|uniref:FAD-dependent monooxygenase n=1 Tax=Brevibacterium sp. GP-SGM9 TaxID=3376990 RepID=UPI0039A441D4
MRIGIVGAGIGGLSAAVGLHRAGAEVRVFERAKAVRAGGSGLSIFANGLTALDALGLREEFETVTDKKVESLTAGQRKTDGSWIARLPSGSVGELRIVDRADLHRILLDNLPAGTVRTSAEVTSASPEGTLTFRYGPDETFDLTIGADGLHSRIREVVVGQVPIRYSGYSAWRGITSVPVDLEGAAGESVGRGRRFGIAPLADGRVYWFAVANMPERAVFADEKATVEQMFAGWHSPIADLIAATPAEAIGRTPISDLGAHLPRFHTGRIVLLGDAAHAMTPNLGQGGGQALEDAATLARLLAAQAESELADEDLAEVLSRYDRLRRRRTQSIAAKSRLLGTLFQLESAPLIALRNTLIGLAPPRLMAAEAERAQRWDPPES